MRPKQINFDTLADDTNYAALSQQLAAAGNLTLEAVAAGLFTPQQVTITSSADIQTITFTVVGLDQNGNSQTEDITGVNNNTVAGALYYTAITSIYGDAGTGANSVEAGINGIASFICPVSQYDQGYRIQVGGTFVGTYSVEFTNVDIHKLGIAEAEWTSEIEQDAKTGPTELFYGGGITAFRLNMTAFTSGNVEMNVTSIPY